MLGPGGSDGNQVTEAFFHLISDEATGNHMTSLKTMIEHQYSPLFFTQLVAAPVPRQYQNC